jgi:outer membrane protein assembly factor BamD (BamD/ComL family)
MKRVLLSIALVLCSASCTTTTYTGHDFDEDFTPSNAAQHVDKAKAEIENGELEIGLDRLIELHQTPSLDPTTRKEAGELLEVTLLQLIDLLIESESPNRLKRLFNLELPPRLRVTSGIAAGRAYLADEERVKCFKMLRKVEETFPMHHLRMPAGDLLLEAGLSLANDETTWLYLFSPAQDRALEVLDFMVLNYPSHPGCDSAYAALADLYESSSWNERAIQNLEDLVAFHPNSALAVRAEARIPLLRMERLRRSDHDRSEILRAREEAASWLSRFPDHELEPDVRALLYKCSSRLVENDLITARYYLKIEENYGATLHAERAWKEALLIGDTEHRDEAEALFETLGTEPPALPVGPMPSGNL